MPERKQSKMPQCTLQGASGGRGKRRRRENARISGAEDAGSAAEDAGEDAGKNAGGKLGVATEKKLAQMPQEMLPTMLRKCCWKR